MHKIVALWAVPRSTSTAFEWMMRQRGDLDCLHEPFGEAWYQGEDPLWPRYKNGEKTTVGLSIESVWGGYSGACGAWTGVFERLPALH